MRHVIAILLMTVATITGSPAEEENQQPYTLGDTQFKQCVDLLYVGRYMGFFPSTQPNFPQITRADVEGFADWIRTSQPTDETGEGFGERCIATLYKFTG